MNKPKNLSGQKFGRLTALYRLHNYHKKGTHWFCVCDCGKFVWGRLERGWDLLRALTLN